MLSILQTGDFQQDQIAVFLIAGSLLWLVAAALFNSKRAGLSHIPGPFIARYTNLWAVYVAWKTEKDGNRASFNRKLQARYGDVVRTGPRSVSVMDPAAIPVIYGVRSKLDKVSVLISIPNLTSSSLIVRIRIGQCIYSIPASRSEDKPSQYPRREDSRQIPQACIECILINFVEGLRALRRSDGHSVCQSL